MAKCSVCRVKVGTGEAPIGKHSYRSGKYLCVDCFRAQQAKKGPSFRQRMAELEDEPKAPKYVPAAKRSATPPASVDDPYERLRKLAELRDEGVISVDDFERKKAEILAEL